MFGKICPRRASFRAAKGGIGMVTVKYSGRQEGPRGSTARYRVVLSPLILAYTPNWASLWLWCSRFTEQPPGEVFPT
jgi:hypothetical protein